MTIQITEPQTPNQRREIRAILHGDGYRKGTDRFIFCDEKNATETMRQLNLIPGVRAFPFQVYASLQEVQILH